MRYELEEIRLNKDYTTKAISTYAGISDTDEESIPIINKRIIRTKEFIEKINQINPNKNIQYHVDHLFPPNCRYFEQQSDGFLVVIEEPPAFRTIMVDKDMFYEIQELKKYGKLEEYGYQNWYDSNKKPYKLTLALPYVIFFLTFTKHLNVMAGRIFCRTQPLSGFSDILYKLPFLNISPTQTVCFGDDVYRGPRRSIYADVNHVISSFWSTTFNEDYIENYLSYQHTPIFGNYLSWEYHSNKDPMFIYNADWIVHNKSVNIEISKMRRRIQSQENNRRLFNYHNISDLINTPSKKEMIEVPGIKAMKSRLLYDVAQLAYIGNQYCSVGDSFKDNSGQRLYIDSFMGFRESSSPLFVNLQREDKKIYRFKLTPAVKQYIKTKLMEERYIKTATLSNGKTIKAGDILIMKNMHNDTIYRKLQYIRKTITNEIEARIGSQYYIVKNIDKDTEIFDESKIKYFDITLNIDDEYVYINSFGNRSSGYFKGGLCKYKGCTISNNRPIMQFVYIEGRHKGCMHEVVINDTHTKYQTVYRKESLIKLPRIFNLGRTLVHSNNALEETNNSYVIPNLGVVVLNNSILTHASKITEVESELIKDDKFSVKSWNSNIEFKIGDKVVVSNWNDPNDMLTVKQIQGFVTNKNTGEISFTLIDNNNNIYNYPYVKNTSIIKIGEIRKITNIYNDLSAGMKITANTKGIPMFPKKDTNIIIGFLYDTGGPEPLVLCSNTCTLWYSDVIEKFNIIKKDDVTWKRKKHAPINLSKIKYQAGDLIKYNNDNSDTGFLVYKTQETNVIRATHLYLYYSRTDFYSFDNHFIESVTFDCFPNPRMTTSQNIDFGKISAVPNFHGMFIYTAIKSHYNFINDKRSVINVSSNS